MCSQQWVIEDKACTEVVYFCKEVHQYSTSDVAKHIFGQMYMQFP